MTKSGQEYTFLATPSIVDERLCGSLSILGSKAIQGHGQPMRSAMIFFLLAETRVKQKRQTYASDAAATHVFARTGDLRTAVALMVAFRGLLRAEEKLPTQASHCVMPTRPGPVIITLQFRNQGNVVMLPDPLLRQYLAALSKSRPHSAFASRQLATVFVSQRRRNRTFWNGNRNPRPDCTSTRELQPWPLWPRHHGNASWSTSRRTAHALQC